MGITIYFKVIRKAVSIVFSKHGDTFAYTDFSGNVWKMDVKLGIVFFARFSKCKEWASDIHCGMAQIAADENI